MTTQQNEHDADSRVLFEPLVRKGCTVLWDHDYWVVRRVNLNRDGDVFSLTLDKPGVTTCVTPSDVVVVS